MILGPTATGKSSLAIKLAKGLNGEIISADSMQVYRGMDIGTAKPSKEEQGKVPHHLIDLKDPDKSWTVSDFISRANEIISSLHKRGKLPILVGGTGLYLNSFLEGYSFPITAPNPALRARLEKEEASKLWEKLNKIDAAAAGKISKNDKKRIIRALEVYEGTGMPISKLQKRSPITDIYNVIMVGLNMDREKLYEKINKRVDLMIESGLIEEVKGLLAKGYDRTLTSMQALGYKETIDHLEGKRPLGETIDLIKQKTRNFARRQMTWFRRFKDVKWFEGGEKADHEVIVEYIKEKMSYIFFSI
jgi:tRNA dimethylallyltransferase